MSQLESSVRELYLGTVLQGPSDHEKLIQHQQNVSVEVDWYDGVDCVKEEDAEHFSYLSGGVVIRVHHPWSTYRQTCTINWLSSLALFKFAKLFSADLLFLNSCLLFKNCDSIVWANYKSLTLLYYLGYLYFNQYQIFSLLCATLIKYCSFIKAACTI